jgi:hypothetical protein
MTERWRKKLEGIDHVDPSDDVYQRAKSGPNLPEPRSPMQRTSTRVVTAIAAFVVFALGISLFAIPALRLGGNDDFVSGGAQVEPLWPWNSIDAVKTWMERPYPIGFMGEGAFSSPDVVAAAFGQEVLGWPEVWAHEEGTPQTYPCANGMPWGVGTSPSPTVPGDLCAVVYPSASVAATLVPYAPTTAPPAFRTFDLSTCPPNAACDYSVGPPDVSVVVYQPSGSDGPWAILEAKTVLMSISLAPGTALRDGSTVYASGVIPRGTQAVLGFTAASEGCGGTGSLTGFEETPNDAGSHETGILLGTYSRGQLGIGLAPVEASCQHEAGYVFVAITQKDLGTGDPLGGIRSDVGVVGFAAVPVSFAFPTSSGAPPSDLTTSTPVEWTTYSDKLGWSIDVPNGWSSGLIAPDPSVPHSILTVTGSWFSSGAVASLPSCEVSTPTPGTTETSCAEGPVASPGQMVLIVDHSAKSPDIRDDSSLPLDPDPFIRSQGKTGGAFFFADGIEFGISMYTSDDMQLSPEQEAVVRKMISSIRFQPWSPGEIRGDFAALNPTANRPASWKQGGLDWQQIGGRTFVYMENGQNGVLLGPIPDCGPGEVQDASTNVRAPLLECPDGTKGGWTIDGQPLMDNSPDLAYGVPASHVVRAWDGTLISPVVPLP